jgi:hypothetical protein
VTNVLNKEIQGLKVVMRLRFIKQTEICPRMKAQLGECSRGELILQLMEIDKGSKAIMESKFPLPQLMTN